jgi:hypothetical protein
LSFTITVTLTFLAVPIERRMHASPLDQPSPHRHIIKKMASRFIQQAAATRSNNVTRPSARFIGMARSPAIAAGDSARMRLYRF